MGATRTLVRHFLGSLIGRGVLQDDGVEAVRGLMFGVVAALMSVGFMLPRQFSRVYLELSYLADPEPFRRAMVADSLFMLTLPLLVGLAAAALVSGSIFPDEVDYLTLVPLPITKRRIFIAKVTALALFVGALLAALAVFAAISFPMFTHQRWAQGHILARIGAHGLAAAGSGMLGFLCVVTVQGLGTVWAPRRWLPRLTVLVPSAVITSVILALPFVIFLPAQRRWVATEPLSLAFVPSAWFVGFERVLLGIATPYWQRMAVTGLVATVVMLAVVALVYAWLFRKFERLVLPPPRAEVSATIRARAARVRMGVWQFTRATLVRNRLPLLLSLVFAAIGAGIVTLYLLNGLVGSSFRWDEPAPPDLLTAVVVLPLILTLTGLTGLRTAFLLPVQSRANWIFRLTDVPRTRAQHLAAVDYACLRLVVVPTLTLAAPLQLWVIGFDAWRTLLLSLLAGLVMAELLLVDWRRVPFTCTWIPGKRPLVFTLVGAIGALVLVMSVLGSLIRLSLFSWPLMTGLAGILLTISALARYRREQAWGTQPLQFEDEPFQAQVLGLR